MSEKRLFALARAVSIIASPFYLSLVGMILLFWFSYLSLLPWRYKLFVVVVVYLFTILFPTLLIRLYSHNHGWQLFELVQKERRVVPYIISLVSYVACYFLLTALHVPHVICSILVIGILLLLVCAFINVWWKISTHAAAIGAVSGSIVVFSLLFGFYLLWWLCAALIVSGCVCSARLVLRLHTLPQVLVGYAVGFATAIVAVLVL